MLNSSQLLRHTVSASKNLKKSQSIFWKENYETKFSQSLHQSPQGLSLDRNNS